MINSATKHNQAQALATHDKIMRAQPTDDATSQVACDLHHRMAPALTVGQYDEISLVELAGVIAEGGAELPGGVNDALHLAVHGRAIYMHVQRRHEDAHFTKAAIALVGRRPLADLDHFAVGT